MYHILKHHNHEKLSEFMQRHASESEDFLKIISLTAKKALIQVYSRETAVAAMSLTAVSSSDVCFKCRCSSFHWYLFEQNKQIKGLFHIPNHLPQKINVQLLFVFPTPPTSSYYCGRALVAQGAIAHYEI